jgi:hypothetical protein
MQIDVLSVVSYQLSVISYLIGHLSQTTGNRQLEPRTKNQEQRLCGANWNFLLFSYLLLHTSDLRQLEPRTKNQEQRLCGANWNFLLFSYFIPPTSDNWSQEQRTKNKDCVVLIEIFCFFHTSTKVISCQLSVIWLGTLVRQQKMEAIWVLSIAYRVLR